MFVSEPRSEVPPFFNCSRLWRCLGHCAVYLQQQHLAARLCIGTFRLNDLIPFGFLKQVTAASSPISIETQHIHSAGNSYNDIVVTSSIVRYFKLKHHFRMACA